jgi:hypothetical protein
MQRCIANFDRSTDELLASKSNMECRTAGIGATQRGLARVDLYLARAHDRVDTEHRRLAAMHVKA